MDAIMEICVHAMVEATKDVIRAEIRVHFKWGKCQMNTLCFSAPPGWRSLPPEAQKAVICYRFKRYITENPNDFVFPVDWVEVVAISSGRDIVTFEGIGPYSCLVTA